MKNGVLSLLVAIFLIAVGGFSNAADKEIDAAKIFRQKCSYCHGNGGVGSSTAPAFIGNSFITEGDPAAIKFVIENGRKEAIKRAESQKLVPMPPWKGRLKDAEIDALVVYLKSLNK